MKSLSIALRTAALFSTALLWLGCYAGGTTGTGIQYSGYGTGSRTAPSGAAESEIRYLTVAGQISDSGGRPVNEAQITARTARSREESESTADGYYSVFLVRGADEAVELTVEIEGRSYRSAWRPATGGDYVNLNIVVDQTAGSLTLQSR